MSQLGSIGLRALLAIGLSFALWMFVSFTENPDETVSFEGLSLAVRSLDNGLIMVDQNSLPSPVLPNASVTIITDQRQRSQIRSSDLRTFVDLSELGPGEHTVPVSFETVREDLQVSLARDGLVPPNVTVRIEELITRTVPISLEIEGNLPFSFELGQPSIRRNTQLIEEVVVSGPQSRVERVILARGVVNVEQIRASYSGPLQLLPVDENDQLIEGVSLDPTQVNVTIPIRPVVGLRLVPIVADIGGLPAAGFSVSRVEVNPPLIAITGSSGALDAVESIRTASIDLGNTTQSLTRTVALLFPIGTSASAGEPIEVEVSVVITPLNRPFQLNFALPVNLVGTPSAQLVSFQPQTVSITVSGSTQALNNLSNTVLAAQVDIEGLGAGVYNLTPSIALPNNVRLIGEMPTVEVVLRVPPPPPTPEPTDIPTEIPLPTPTITLPPPTSTVTLPTVLPTNPAENPTETPTETEAPAEEQPSPEPTSEG